MSSTADFGWLEFPVAVSWGAGLSLEITTRMTASPTSDPVSAIVFNGLPLPSSAFTSKQTVQIGGKKPNFAVEQTTQIGSGVVATDLTGDLAKIKGMRKDKGNVPLPFNMIVGPPPPASLDHPTYWKAWRGFAGQTGSPLFNDFASVDAHSAFWIALNNAGFPANRWADWGVGRFPNPYSFQTQAAANAWQQAILGQWRALHAGIESWFYQIDGQIGTHLFNYGVSSYVDPTAQTDHALSATIQIETTGPDGVLDSHLVELGAESLIGVQPNNVTISVTVDYKTGEITVTVGAAPHWNVWVDGVHPGGQPNEG